MIKVDTDLEDKIRKLVESKGYEYVGCELLPQGKDAIFRIYIDNPPTGVTVDDCAAVSYQVGAMLDVLDPFEGRYTLEVSSPGVDRPLFGIEQYQKYIGSQVKIRLNMAVQQRKQYKGILQRVDEENIYLLIEGLEQEVKLPFSQIGKANLIGYRKMEDRKQKSN